LNGGTELSFDEAALTKGEMRKLNALRKAVGDDLGREAFGKWFKARANAEIIEKTDPTAEKLAAALSALEKDASFRLGHKGYTIRRARGKGASGFIVTKNEG
jgi:hypothetical protein